MNPDEFYAWLASRIQDGGANSLKEVFEFAREESELLLKGPAMAAMLCWGKGGCEAIASLAVTHPSSKTISGALKLLAAASAGVPIDPTLLFVHSGELSDAVNEAVAQGRLRQIGRKCLMDLLQSLNTDDLLISLGVAFTQLGMISGQGTSELIRAISSRWLHVGPTVMNAYQSLIEARPGDEPAFQEFFCQHPQILDPMALQVWSQPDFHGLLEPDFVIRRSDNSYLIVEIECPAKPLMTQAGQLSEKATHAEKQTTDYRQFLDERIAEARQHFPNYQSGECLAVVGLESPLTNLQCQALKNVNSGRHRVRIVGFDWLAQRASAIIENISSGDVEVVRRHRVT